MFSPSALSTKTVAAPPPTPPCGYGKPSDGFRLLLLSGDAAAPPADSDCVHVWSRPLTGPTQSGFRDLLSEEECAAASRFHTPELAERYRQAHGWMRSVLSRYLDTPPETLRFRSGPDGKPRLAHGSLHFNLAHSDSLALLAVRQDAPVGVDVEPVRPLPEAMLIACRWLPSWFTPPTAATLQPAAHR